jgi:23S rRNA G2069 N7-methylase RlmK/C1962 C5-methylase RlmI
MAKATGYYLDQRENRAAVARLKEKGIALNPKTTS